jgi:acetyltransferase
MRQHGIVRVYNLDEMMETLAAFYADRLPQGPGVGAIYVSGGAAGLISDLAQDLDIPLPDLASHTVERLEKVIPEFGTVGNPLDTTGMGGAIPELMEGALVGMAEDPSIHTVIYGQAFPVQVDLDTPTGQVMQVIPERYPDKVFVTVALVTGKIAQATKRGTREIATNTTVEWGGVPFLQGAENGLKAVRSLNRYATFLRQRNERAQAPATGSDVVEQARAIIAEARGLPLVERRAKDLLKLYGLPVTRERQAATADEAVHAAEEIGYPVVLKIESPEITHKTEAGGVLLGVNSDEAVRDGFGRIMASAARYAPGAQLSGVLVQEMAPPGRELILGMTRDQQFGPVVAVGVGGIFVEVLKDVALGVPPLDQSDAVAMLDRLRGKAILEGARGAEPADIAAIIDIIERFGQLSLDLADLVAEIDINPLIVYSAGQGAKVVDCLIVPQDQ